MMSEDDLMARAARLHYEFDLTHQEVAATLGLSRVKVTRMLKKARQTGLVQITVLTELSLFVTMEEELCSRFGLVRAVVVPDSVSHERTPLSAVARGGATFLNQIARDDLVVAVGLSRAVAEIPRWLGVVRPARVHFVSLVGASRAVGGTRNSPYLATDALATAYCGTAEHLHAPVIVRSRSMAEELILEPSVAEPLARAAGADAAFVGIGGIKDRAELGWAADVPSSEWAELVAAGMVGDIAGRFFDQAGELIDHEINHRVIGLTLDQFAAVPTRVVVAAGPTKVEPLLAAMRRGLPNVLITDASTAKALLQTPPTGLPAPPTAVKENDDI
jgi:DNA-binding transcriptional regulator LsrR (DeoR family)